MTALVSAVKSEPTHCHIEQAITNRDMEPGRRRETKVHSDGMVQLVTVSTIPHERTTSQPHK